MPRDLGKKELHKICKHCKGNGFVQGQINVGTCLFCRGAGYDSRTKSSEMQKIIELTQEFITGGKKGGSK